MEFDLDGYQRMIDIKNWTGKIVRHFKGDYYIIMDTDVTHTETNERMIYYKALYGDCKSYVRPAKMFIEKCSPEQFKKYNQQYRFELVNIDSKKR